MKKKSIEKRLKAVEDYFVKRKINLRKTKNLILMLGAMLTVYIPIVTIIVTQTSEMFNGYALGTITVGIAVFILTHLEKVDKKC